MAQLHTNANPIDLAWDNYCRHGNYIDYLNACNTENVKPMPSEDLNFYINAEIQACGGEANYSINL